MMLLFCFFTKILQHFSTNSFLKCANKFHVSIATIKVGENEGVVREGYSPAVLQPRQSEYKEILAASAASHAA